MKGLFLSCYFLVFCGVWSLAQNSKQKNYDKLVNYVNVFYLKAYFNKKINDTTSSFSTEFKNDYTNRIATLWGKTLSNIDNYKTEDLTKNLGNYENAIRLFNLISRKKETYHTKWNKDSVINYLVKLPSNLPTPNGGGYSGYLSDATKSLESILKQNISDDLTFNNKFVENAAINQKTGNNSHPKIDIKKGDIKNHNSKISIWLIITVVLGLVLIIIIYRNLTYIKTLFIPKHFEDKPLVESDDSNYKKKYKEQCIENQRLRNIEDENAQLRTKVKLLEQRIREFEQNKPEKTSQSINQTDHSEVFSVKNQTNDFVINSKKLFADAIIDNNFHRVIEKPNEDTVYELFPVSTKLISFQIYREAYKRVVKNPDFVDGCDKQRINPHAQTLEVESGEAELDDFGKWRVTKRAIIKFI